MRIVKLVAMVTGVSVAIKALLHLNQKIEALSLANKMMHDDIDQKIRFLL
ncbi:MAG: hypothetical protein FWC66_07130 [Oscillospiraceae bacterium]|nr:hypothetical protein [Oscillospiraceae bacterium]